jgi:hypothetical protein
MAKTLEIVLGYVEKPVAVGAAGSSVTDQYNSDKSGFALVNQSAQTGAAVAGVTSIVKLTAGFTPFLNIKTNTLAATTVLLKITAQYRTDQTFENGDVLSLVGNVAGIVGGITLLAGAGSVAGVFTAVGVGANALGMLNSDVANNLYHSFIAPVLGKHFVANEHYPEYWVAPDLTLASLAQISAIYTGKIAVSRWNPDSQSVALGSEPLHLYEIVGGGGGGYIEGISGGGGPLIFPLPESPGWSVDIGPIQIIEPGGNSFGVDRYH